MTLSSLRWRACLAPVVTALSLLVLGGCAPKEKATVKGTVTWAGQPVKMGTVVFTPADNQGSPGSGVIDGAGNYDVNDAPVGNVKVYISLPPRPMGPVGAAAPPPGMGMPADQQGKVTGGMPSSNPQDYPFSLPDKYTKAETTDVTFKVEKGQNTFNITLKP